MCILVHKTTVRFVHTVGARHAPAGITFLNLAQRWFGSRHQIPIKQRPFTASADLAFSIHFTSLPEPRPRQRASLDAPVPFVFSQFAKLNQYQDVPLGRPPYIHGELS